MATLSAILAFRARLTRRMIASATATNDYSVLLQKMRCPPGNARPGD